MIIHSLIGAANSVTQLPYQIAIVSYPVVNHPVPTHPTSQTINIVQNVAYYQIYLPGGIPVINFNTIGSNNGNPLDTMIGVFDSVGNLLGYDDDSGGSGWSSLNLSNLVAGTYFVGVSLFYTHFFNGGAIGNNPNPDINKIIFTVQ